MVQRASAVSQATEQTIFQCNYCHYTDYAPVINNIRDWEYGVTGSYDYYQCSHCEGVQLNPFPNLEDLKLAYDIDYHGYAEGQKRGLLFSALYAAKEKLFRRHMRKFVNPSSKVLDVGCGAGDFLDNMQSLGVSRLEGIDFSQEMIDKLNARGITGHCGTFPQFDAESQSYDLISMNNYLEHTLAPVQELEKSFDLLRCGGHLVGEVPGFDSWERRLFGRYWGGNHVPRHTYQFNTDFLYKTLQSAGYQDIQISHQLNTGHWALSVQNFLQRKAPDLKHNPAISNGRSRVYVPMLLLFIPINIFCVLMRKSGCIKFTAQKPLANSDHD
jgi:SAM-dependent methyltransferase